MRMRFQRLGFQRRVARAGGAILAPGEAPDIEVFPPQARQCCREVCPRGTAGGRGSTRSARGTISWHAACKDLPVVGVIPLSSSVHPSDSQQSRPSVDFVVPCGRPASAAAARTLRALVDVTTGTGHRVFTVGAGVEELGPSYPENFRWVD